MKRIKKTPQIQQQLTLDTQTVKQLTAKDFTLVDGAGNGNFGRNTCTCKSATE